MIYSRRRLCSLPMKSAVRHTWVVEKVGWSLGVATQLHPQHSSIRTFFFVELFLTHMRYWGSSGWPSSQVRQYKCMHTKSIDFLLDSADLPCARKYIICVFLPPHLCVFSMNYSWQPIWGVKEASDEKNFTHFLLDYVWSNGNCTLFSVGTTLSWRTIHDLAIAGFFRCFNYSWHKIQLEGVSGGVWRKF